MPRRREYSSEKSEAKTMTRDTIARACGALLMSALCAAPAMADDAGVNAKGYANLFGGPIWAGGNSSGNIAFEGGVRVAPHLMVFGTLGHFKDLQADLQPTLTTATTSLSTQGIGVTGTGTLPARYLAGGLRAEIPAGRRAVPYLLGGVGVARLAPTTRFAFASGALPDGSSPDIGTDVTSTLTSSGALVTPSNTSAAMVMFGGGVQVPIAAHWAGDVGYRVSRIAADTSLASSALNTQALTFGVGYRF
jgi:opacity protein-like surface antigen